MKSIDFGAGATASEMFAMNSSEGENVPWSAPVSAAGNVEDWLCDVEAMMRTSLYDHSKAALKRYPAPAAAEDRAAWYFTAPAQSILLVDQIMWTQNCAAAIRGASSNPESLAQFKSFSLRQIDKMVSLVRGELTRLQRTLLGALVVIDVHARDVTTALVAKGVSSLDDFDWTKQLRYYWDADADNCIVRQTNTRFVYGYEYLGNTERLVITPLTDQCYMTLTGALHLKFGGAPAGPAGTGKTETTKDLAKALANQVGTASHCGIERVRNLLLVVLHNFCTCCCCAIHQCVVFNCSDGLDYKMMGRFFSGLAQAGAWSCFDEFNRIDIEVLSVIAQQILVIQQGLMARSATIQFEGREIPVRSRGFRVRTPFAPAHFQFHSLAVEPLLRCFHHDEPWLRGPHRAA
jgi:dynein heavy chain, axonemal